MLQQYSSKFAILFEYKNPRSFLCFSFRATLCFSLAYVDIDQGINYGENKVARNEKQTKSI